jgi:hypothetical protein
MKFPATGSFEIVIDFTHSEAGGRKIILHRFVDFKESIRRITVSRTHGVEQRRSSKGRKSNGLHVLDLRGRSKKGGNDARAKGVVNQP